MIMSSKVTNHSLHAASRIEAVLAAVELIHDVLGEDHEVPGHVVRTVAESLVLGPYSKVS